jgi:periplasmic glucans biosynthesis protein
MYFFGPERRAGWDDFRDAVHDSDGLSIVNGAGETIWRPLTNPAALQYSAFQDENPRRFGLMQRARDFAQYQDAEARYEMRPSAWVEPEGDWGRGSVDLVEIPTRDEFADNIVAYWRPAEPLAARGATTSATGWSGRRTTRRGLARVVATRGGGSILDERERVFVIDFDLGPVPFEGLSPRLQVSEGEVAGSVGLSFHPRGARQGRVPLPAGDRESGRVPAGARRAGGAGVRAVALPLDGARAGVTGWSLRARPVIRRAPRGNAPQRRQPTFRSAAGATGGHIRRMTPSRRIAAW